MFRLAATLAISLRRHSRPLTVGLVLAAAAGFRLYRLPSLPPGLHPAETPTGTGLAPLWRGLESLAVHLFGRQPVALRLVPAVAGILVVALIYAWAKQWFKGPIALIAAWLAATSPWAVTLTRWANPRALAVVAVTLSLYLIGRWFQHRRAPWLLGAAAVLAAGCYADRGVGWWAVGLMLAAASSAGWDRDWARPQLRAWAVALGGFLVLAAPAFILVKDFKFHLPNWGAQVVKIGLMFNLRGDENFLHNLGGQPLLNVFVGLMFILGIMVCLVRLHRPKYRTLLILLVAALTPALLAEASAPDANAALLALPVVMVIAAVGVNYMLDYWTGTFPLNAAARDSGLAAIVMVLIISAYQGYSQYFVAWAQSPQTEQAFRTDLTELAKFINRDRFSGQRYVIADAESNRVIGFFVTTTTYRRLDPSEVDALVIDHQPKRFYIAAGQLTEGTKKLGLKFPGGDHQPQLDAQDNPQFLVYTVTK
jgi:uncharacterized membrane protein